MKLDVLAFGVHPDDVELSCGGVLLVEKKQGKKKQRLKEQGKKLCPFCTWPPPSFFCFDTFLF